jgi:5-carboxyvanillate decarboxylase
MTDTQSFRKIATEEAFSIPEIARALQSVTRSASTNLDLKLIKTIYDNPSENAVGSELRGRLLDLDRERLRIMDENHVDMHVLSLTAPGVQMFDADTATDLAALANDKLAQTIARNPTRFAGLASFAPHSPARAVKEMERAIHSLGLHGFIPRQCRANIRNSR